MVNQSVTSALATEALVAPMKCIVVDAAKALTAAIAEFRRPLSATVARRHCLVERAKSTSLHLFASLGLQALMSTMLMGWTAECGRRMRWVWMSARSRVRIRMRVTSMMLWIGMRVGLGLRFGFHVDSSRKNSSPVIDYF